MLVQHGVELAPVPQHRLNAHVIDAKGGAQLDVLYAPVQGEPRGVPGHQGIHNGPLLRGLGQDGLVPKVHHLKQVPVKAVQDLRHGQGAGLLVTGTYSNQDFTTGVLGHRPVKTRAALATQCALHDVWAAGFVQD